MIDGTQDAFPATIQDVCGDHRGADVFMSEQFLNGADVITALQ